MRRATQSISTIVLATALVGCTLSRADSYQNEQTVRKMTHLHHASDYKGVIHFGVTSVTYERAEPWDADIEGRNTLHNRFVLVRQMFDKKQREDKYYIKGDTACIVVEDGFWRVREHRHEWDSNKMDYSDNEIYEKISNKAVWRRR
jgi:hypothetical protein